MKALILSLVVAVPAVLGLASFSAAPPVATKDVRVENRPKVPGKLRLNLRERREETKGNGDFKIRQRTEDWDVAETAIVVCDMWDDHYCKIAAQRVGVMAPRMNQVLTAARDRGVMILFAPSETMNIYEGSPQRTRMQQAAPVKPPVPILKRCARDPNSDEPPLPIDPDVNGCDDCDQGPEVRRHSRQHPALDITGFDGISDDGEEIYNFCRQEGIKNIVLMGVHTNYCIMNRSFGIRQTTRLGMKIVLVRDLTDALVDPRQPPFVSHARGTEMIVEHIEKHWCPSITSADLMRVAPGSDGPQRAAP